MVVEFNSDALEELGADIQNAADGAFSAINTSFGSLTQNSISFARTTGETNVTTFKAIVNFLVSQDKARLVARPYLATLSGQPANINITRDRYVVVQQAESGASVTTTAPVSSGVLMSITPYAMPDDKIRIDVNVEDSAFIPTTGNVTVEVDKNAAQTSMLVDSGQSIIIGGLVLNQFTSSNSGFPWLRHIPIVNFLFAKQSTDLNRKEVIIYLTPKIWKPDLTSPIYEPKALTIPEDSESLTEFEKLGTNNK